jgi:hypothetical protein
MSMTLKAAFDLGWLAGILDGEGHFGISQKRTRDSLPRWFKPVISLRITAEEPCRKARAVTGRGTVRLLGKRTSTGKEVWEWQVTCLNAIAVCKAVVAHLAVKQGQADIIIRLGKLMAARTGSRNRPLSEEETAQRIAFKDELQRLNDRRTRNIASRARAAVNRLMVPEQHSDLRSA